MHPMRSIIILAALVGTALAGPATQPSTTVVMQPTADNLEVHEWAVFVVDAAAGQINPQGWVKSTLPDFVTDHRFAPAGAEVQLPITNNGMVFNGRFWMQAPPAAPPPPLKPDPAELPLPSPVGVIRLVGSVDSKVDVTVSTRSGSFLGSWPKAEDRDKQLLWRDISAVDKSDASAALVSAGHWFNELRSAKSDYLSFEKGNDRFLLYDLEAPYSSPLKVKAGSDFKFEISNSTAAPLHDLMLYEGDRDSWRSAAIGELAAATQPPKPTTAPAAPPSPKPQLGISVTDVSQDPGRASNFGYTGKSGLIVDNVQPGSLADGNLKPADIILQINGQDAKNAKEFPSQITGGTIALKVFRANSTIDVEIKLPAPATAPVVATTRPSTSPVTVASTRPAVATTTPPTTAPTARSYQLATVPTTQPADLAESWKPIMASHGVDPADAAVITRLIARYAFDPHRLTAVYRMDDAELDQLLPLEVVPQPAKITRFALVIVINADPTAGTVVDDLIKQLGDDDWDKREAAYQALAAMGPAAQAKLTGAKGSKDLEVAWRAERLLAQLQAAGK